jgi:thioredoxin reductase
MNNLFDCAIIGGGPAGLNAALVLGRARRNTVLLIITIQGMQLHKNLMDLSLAME